MSEQGQENNAGYLSRSCAMTLSSIMYFYKIGIVNQTHIYEMYKRKRTSPATRRRVRRRTAYGRKSMLTRNPNVSTFRLKCKSFLTNWTFSTATTFGFWRYLSLNPAILTSFTEHAAIFDEYKLYGYQYEFRPSYDGVDYNAAVASLGNMHIAVDPGSTVSPSGVYGTTTLTAEATNRAGHCKSLYEQRLLGKY